MASQISQLAQGFCQSPLGPVTVTIELFDEDDGLRFADDVVDINPVDDVTSLTLIVDPNTGNWSGDVPMNQGFATGDGDQEHVSNPIDGEGEPARIFFGVTTRSASGDADGDGLLDTWEEIGIEEDGNPGVDLNLRNMGARWDHKDLFLELDWMRGNAPNRANIQAMKAAFANAPITAGSNGAALPNGVNAPQNPDGQPGINLWVDTGTLSDPTAAEDGGAAGTCGDGIDNGGGDGADANDPDCLVGDNLGGGTQIPTTVMRGLDGGFYTAKGANFNANRRMAFRYAIAAQAGMEDGSTVVNSCSDGIDNGGDGNADNTDSDCQGFAGGQGEIGGNDFVDYNHDGGTIMHELGHNLNLRHGGFEDNNCKPNYVSVMNYDLQFGIPINAGAAAPPGAFTIPSPIPGGAPLQGILDYSPPRFAGGRGAAPLPNLSEGVLGEGNPLDPTDPSNQFVYTNAQGRKVRWPLQGLDINTPPDGVRERADWDSDGVVDLFPNTINGNNPVNIDAADNNGTPGNPNDDTPRGCRGNTSNFSFHGGHDDWSRISLQFRQFGDRADAAINPELDDNPTLQEMQQLLIALNTTDLQITKTDSPDPAVAGEELQYIITVTNHGPNPASSVRVTDTLPAGVTYVRDDAGCNEGPAGTVVCGLGEIFQNQSRKITITVLVAADLVQKAGGPTTITNRATVENLAGPDSNAENNSVTEETLVIAQSDLKVTKVSKTERRTPFIGEPFEYKVTVENLGPSVPRDVSVTDLLFADSPSYTVSPASYYEISATGTVSGLTAVPATATGFHFTIPTLGVNSQLVITWLIDPHDSGDFHNLVRVASAEKDPFRDNNTDVDDIKVIPAPPLAPDLVEASDSGRSRRDNITNVTSPTFLIGAALNDATVQLLRDGVVAASRTGPGPITDPGVLSDGSYTYTARQISPRGDWSPVSGELSILIDTVAPGGTVHLHPDSDTGIWGFPETMADGITDDKVPLLYGATEANALVRVALDGTPEGTSVALPYDGDDAFPPPPEFDGNYFLQTIHMLSDGEHTLTAFFQDVAGNETTADDAPDLTIFIDSQGPKITNVTRGLVSVDNVFEFDGVASVFEPKPSETGPDPLVHSIVIHFSDLPDRTAAFNYDALLAALAEEEGNYSLKGDHNGYIATADVNVTFTTIANDGLAETAEVELFFQLPGDDEIYGTADDIGAPLPDDRYTLWVSDGITDPAGNALDGESGAVGPFDGEDVPLPTDPIFPTGDGAHGGEFHGRLTIDSRPEIGTFALGSIYLDINGNQVFDAEGKNRDYTNRDITFLFGFRDDRVFAGNFASAVDDPDTPHDERVASGYDKLGGYGNAGQGAAWRWRLDFDHDGVVDYDVLSGEQTQGDPVAGNFTNSHDGDEIGLFNAGRWFLDTGGDNNIGGPGDTKLQGNMRGQPIVGDFDGDGLDDLGAWDPGNAGTQFDGVFQFDLAHNGFTGNAERTIQFDVPGMFQKAVGADMNGDGIDDLGLFVTRREGVPPAEAAEWFWLISDRSVFENDLADPGEVTALAHPFTPVPFGTDIYAQFGDEAALPVVGNFDPPTVPPNNPPDTTTIVEDINRDGVVAIGDMFVLLNHLRTQEAGPYGDRTMDPDGDGWVTISDVVMVLGKLRQTMTSEGEGEADAQPGAALAAQDVWAPVDDAALEKEEPAGLGTLSPQDTNPSANPARPESNSPSDASPFSPALDDEVYDLLFADLESLEELLDPIES